MSILNCLWRARKSRALVTTKEGEGALADFRLPDTYPTRGVALERYNGILSEYGHSLDYTDDSDWSDKEGRETFGVLNGSGDCVGHAVISYYRVQSGKFECVGYLDCFAF